ncbi:NAD(P)-binding Rossmann-like domain protein [Synechococcus sp. BIOS-E4-1]|uniref:UDP-galactopyranose mutase n=1 Tax=Synechococcus sp. BIOS-E4-1 TaxID=1400864 RepID=UPI00164649C4|nr:UDP-galactopyranose mutase [Synechococcus sp. BIOS-E4-1]QNI53554.1 NAD(P)-binding Rossmann-like domain protein [Synechococcus sp. BIOS-E4-1]
MTVLIVGAGFAGATIGRVLAEAGIRSVIIEKRSHIGGNAFDELNEQNERVHRYGPHLLHGNINSEAVNFLSRFCSWVPYEHRVRALLQGGETTPLPINRTTLEDIFNLELSNNDETQKFLDSLRAHGITPTNSDQLFQANVGDQLADLFFRPYTKKMWGVDAKELAVSVGARLPVRTNRDDRYFTDTFQALPSNGYTSLFEHLLDHPLIEVHLNRTFSKDMESGYDHCFLAVPIDQYFDYCYGHLPYRSILFHQTTSNSKQSATQVNFTDSGPYTRMTQWCLLPNSPGKGPGPYQITLEEPCSMKNNPGEYYYPVKTKASEELFKRYEKIAKSKPHITFCGRTGLFRYIDMIPAVSMHLSIARNYLSKLNEQTAYAI